MAVLSIQSQVVRGHVGNSAACFTLQRLGHDVWPVPTVLFSNHPGHGSHRGHDLSEYQLNELMQGLADHEGWLEKVNAVLTGYLGNDDQIEAIGDMIDLVKERSAEMLYVCDPVVGDAEGLYADENIREGLMEDLLPRADIATPNRFELQALLEQPEPIETVNQAIEAARQLPCPITIVSSVEDTARFPGQIQTVLVKENEAYVVSMGKLDFNPKGAGDLLTALTLSGLLKRRPIEPALAHAHGSLYDILSATYRAGAPELLLIGQQERLVTPFTTVTIGRA